MTHSLLSGSEVTIYNSQANPWLGQQNDMQYIYRLGCRRMMCIKSTGGIHTMAEPKALKSLTASFPVAQDRGHPLFDKIMTAATNDAMSAAMSVGKLAFYNPLPVDAPFVSIALYRHDKAFTPERCTKSDYDCGEKYGFAHRGEKNTNSWYCGHNENMVFMSPERWSAFEQSCAEIAAKCDLSLSSYHQMCGRVNAALLRIAQMMGPEAQVEPYDPNTENGRVSMGTLTLSMTENHYMDLCLSDGEHVVESKDNVHSVPDVFYKNLDAVMPQQMSICMMSCVAFEMLARYRARPKRSNKAA